LKQEGIDADSLGGVIEKVDQAEGTAADVEYALAGENIPRAAETQQFLGPLLGHVEILVGRGLGPGLPKMELEPLRSAPAIAGDSMHSQTIFSCGWRSLRDLGPEQPEPCDSI